MKLKISILSLILIVALVLSGCGSDNEYAVSDTTSDSSMEYRGESEDGGWAESADIAPEVMEVNFSEDATSLSVTVTSGSTSESDDSVLEGKVDNRKYIYTFNYYMETLDFDQSVEQLEALVDRYFGFFQSTEVSGRSINDENQRRHGYYVIRIPKEKVEEFTEGLSGIGHVLDENSYAEDVTTVYFDTEARIKTLEVQEQRLLAILEEADELEYIIELERELSDVRYEIESYMSTFRNLEDQINYSTVYVQLSEVYKETVIQEEPQTFGDKLVRGFTDSVESVVSFLEGAALFLLTNIPVFVLLGVIGFVIFLIVRRVGKGKLDGLRSPEEKAKKRDKAVDEDKKDM